MLSLIVLPLSLITMQPLQPKAEIVEPPSQITLTPREVANKYAEQHNLDKDLFAKVINCESSFNPNAINRNEPNKVLSVGILQYQEPSFNYLEKEFGEDLDFYSYNDQLKLGAWSMANGKGNNWSCWRKITNK